MILAVGLTPAWQQIIVLDRLLEGEVNRAREVHWCASGKVVNVAMALARLGGPAGIVTLLGGPTGDSLRRDIAELGLEAAWVPMSRPTRVCTTLIDRASGRTTELVEDASPVGPGEIEDVLGAFERISSAARAIVLTGSIPAGTPATIWRELVRRSRCPVVLDARGPELLEALPERPLVIKPNLEELARTLGHELAGRVDISAALEAVERLGARWTVVSQGRGPLLVRGPDGTRAFRPPEVSTVNPIGCGDCLAAGMAWALGGGAEVLDAVRFGMGVAAQNATTLRPSRVDPDTARRLADLVIEVEP